LVRALARAFPPMAASSFTVKGRLLRPISRY
jgi:hypothetical protein